MTHERYVSEIGTLLRAGNHAGILSMVRLHQRTLESDLGAEDRALIQDAIEWAAMTDALVEATPTADDEIAVSIHEHDDLEST